MSNIETSIAQINQMLEKSGDLKDISKTDFLMVIDLYRKSLQDIINVLAQITKEQSQQLLLKLQESRNDRQKAYLQLYFAFQSKLNPSAISLEKAVFFGGQLAACQGYVVLLDCIAKDIDSLFANKVISIFNTKLSHVAILGAISNANLVADFVSYQFGLVLFDLGFSDSERPVRYRKEFVESNIDEAAILLNNITSRQGDGVCLAEISQLRRNSGDVIVVNDHNEVNTGVMNLSGLNYNMRGSLRKGFMNLNIFRWFGETMNRIRDDHYRRLETRREWLETHISLLKVKLGTITDPKAAEHLQTVISNFDSAFTTLDRKIQAYHNE